MPPIERALLRVIRAVLPRDEREWMTGDLQEEHAAIAAERGRWRAAAWLAVEAIHNLRDAVMIESPRALGRRLMRNILQDLRFARRLMWRAPGFTAVIVVTLALGIGANTAIFSVVDALLFRPLPYPESDRLYAVTLANDKPHGMAYWTAPKYAAFAREQQLFDGTAAYARETLTLIAGEQPQRVDTEVVSAGYFTLLGIRAALGRTFTADEDTVPSRDAVVVLGDAFWRGSFGADPNVVGRTLMIKGRAYAVVGVMPPDFRGQNGSAQIWLPIMMADHFMYSGASTSGASWWLRVVARLKRGVTPAAAEAQLPALTERVGRIDNSRLKTAMRDGRELFQMVPFRTIKVDPAVSRSFVMLLTAVGLVLLIACANTANLLLGRAVARRGEFAIRRALGASRGEIARQVFVESVFLAAIAGVLALSVAWLTLAWLTTVKPMNATGFWSQYARTFDYFAVRLDPRVAAFNFAVALGVGIIFGLLPARQAARRELNDALKERGTVARFRRFSARDALVLAEVALSVALLAGAGLMIKSFANAAATDLGFEPEGVVTTTMSMPQRKPLTFFRELLERVSRTAGGTEAALVLAAPISGESWRGLITFEDRPSAAPRVQASTNVVTPRYFATFRIPLVEGRLFSEDDRDTAPRVAVVNRAFARAAFPGESVIGKRVRTAFRVGYGDPKAWTAIVGVVEDALYGTLEEPRGPMIYLTAWQPLGTLEMISLAPTTIAVRTAAPAAALAAIRAEVRALDSSIPLYDTTAMDQRAAGITSRYRYTGAMMTALAGLALLLAAIGMYGVAAYAVATRTKEIGVRVALGARPGDVMRLVLGGGLKLTAAGLVIGLAGGLAGARLLSSMLYGVAPRDPLTFAAIALLMAAVGTIATYVPARRAMRVDPVIALRAE